MPCQYVFRRGANKGSPCGKRCAQNTLFCKAHTKCVLCIDDIPDLAQATILRYVIGDDARDPLDAFLDASGIHAVSKHWHDLIVPAWTLLYDRLRHQNVVTASQHASMEARRMTHYQRLCLLAHRGCQKCGQARIRKVHWPFPLRCCQDCIRDSTLSAYALQQEYAVDESVLHDLPFMVVEGYNSASRYRWNRTYTIMVYLIEDVERTLGRSLKENVDAQYRQLAEKLAARSGMTLKDLESDDALRKLWPTYQALCEVKSSSASWLRNSVLRWRTCELLRPIKDVKLLRHYNESFEHAYNRALIEGDFEPLRAMDKDAVAQHCVDAHVNLARTKCPNIDLPVYVTDRGNFDETISSIDKKVRLQSCITELGSELRKACSNNDAVDKIVKCMVAIRKPDSKRRFVRRDLRKFVPDGVQPAELRCPTCCGNRRFSFHGLLDHWFDTHAV